MLKNRRVVLNIKGDDDRLIVAIACKLQIACAKWVGSHKEDDASLAGVVRHLLMALLPGGGCTASLVARLLVVERRTLHRHLAAQGQSFSGLLQQLRCEWVHKLLRQGQLPLAGGATLLGFASQMAFAYWFRSRFGCSVSQWRQGGAKRRGN